MEFPVNIRPNALKELKRLIRIEKIRSPEGVRLAYKNNEYKIGFDMPTENDLHFSYQGIRFYIDKNETRHFRDVHLDFFNGLHKRGFFFEKK